MMASYAMVVEPVGGCVDSAAGTEEMQPIS